MANEKTPDQFLADKVVNTEVGQSSVNMKNDYDDFDSAIDLIENVRSEKDYDWMSNISLPEYASQWLTQAATDAATYFQTRDFVEVYHQDDTPEALAAAEANRILINRTLNQRHIHHYSKYMRAKLTNNAFKNVVIRCWWEQETKRDVIGTMPEVVRSRTTASDGSPLLSPDQEPMIEVIESEVEGDIPIIDRFNWDVIHPRNVFYDNTYAYSLQDKNWVTIRYERTLSQLLDDEEEFEYVNLDKLKNIAPPITTEAYEQSDNKLDNWKPAGKNYSFDIYERHGLEWCVVDERDENGNPTKISNGYDENGEVLDDAEQHELIVTVAKSASTEILIRFVPQKYEDASGRKYRPLIRGLNYIHPAKDGGIGDVQYARELQIFINDTLNMSNDRVKMATLPTLIGQKDALQDNETVYLAPEHVIEVFDTQNDLKELRIDSDIAGAAQMLGIGINMSQQVSATFPTTMGALPDESSTKATAIAGAEQRTNTRMSYRSLTWEYTFLTELYWMITQMTYQFAFEETALALFGNEELLSAFRPEQEFFYKPVTGSVETEYSKGNKIKEATTLLGYVMQSPNPKAAMVANFLLAEVFETWGKDKKHYGAMLLDESGPVSQNAVGSVEEGGGPMVSNQNGMPMSGMEQGVRGI